MHTENYNNGLKKDLKKQKDILCLHTKAHNIKMTVFLKCNLYQEFNCFFFLIEIDSKVHMYFAHAVVGRLCSEAEIVLAQYLFVYLT